MANGGCVWPCRRIGYVVGRRRTRTLMHQAGVSVRGRAALAATDHRQSASVAGGPQSLESPVCGGGSESGVGKRPHLHLRPTKGGCIWPLWWICFPGRWLAGPSRPRGRRSVGGSGVGDGNWSAAASAWAPAPFGSRESVCLATPIKRCLRQRYQMQGKHESAGQLLGQCRRRASHWQSQTRGSPRETRGYTPTR